jgi:hypothetical protein
VTSETRWHGETQEAIICEVWVRPAAAKNAAHGFFLSVVRDSIDSAQIKI